MNSPPSTIFLQLHPRARTAIQISAVVFEAWRGLVVARFISVALAVTIFHFILQFITILNRCHRFPGFVYQQARFSCDYKSVEITVHPRKGSKAICALPSARPRIRSTRRAPLRI